MVRSITIHGHFYQPPRENAWLEEVEVQDSAYPYHDWNERISAESYAPNAASRILDAQDLIIDIVNNYARISFDFGPTLLTWMDRARPDIYGSLLEADKESRRRHGGHGGAMAQAYNHLIMPLASSRDKRTQVLWGLADFEGRFGRKPEGMWLPETAVDLESLDIMAEQGILFTILSPYQASRVRPLEAKDWQDARGGKIDPKKPYLCRLPSGRSIALFFYDGPISHDIAFGDLLGNGENFAKRLVGAFSQSPAGDELVHVATDGETYGHHHRFGDMALAYALRYLELNKLGELTVYGQYLEAHPPADEVEIVPNSAWSCAHGVERWRSDCGDSSGAHPGWNQKWRTPLRQAMDFLRDRAGSLFEEGLGPLTPDPWAVRDDYIRIIRDRSTRSVEDFLGRHFQRPLGGPDKTRVLKLLEIQRQAMLVYTSDGWFFDDISNIETIQVIQYAARALQLIRDVSQADLEVEFVGILEKAASNIPEQENGARVYERWVKPSVVSFPRLAAHYAVSSLFKDYPQESRIAHYEVQAEACVREVQGARHLAGGKVRLKSEITWEEHTMAYAVLHLGELNLVAGVKELDDWKAFEASCRDLQQAFARSDGAGAIRIVDRVFGTHSYSLWHLFRDERRTVLDHILEANLSGLEATFRQVFESNYSIMQAMKELQIPLPEALSAPAEFVLNADLRRALTRDKLDFDRLAKLAAEFRFWGFKPDLVTIDFITGRKIDELMARSAARPDDLEALGAVEKIFSILSPLIVELDLWKSQNIYFAQAKKYWKKNAEAAAKGNARAKEWVELFGAVGRNLRFNPDVFGKR